MHSALTAIKPGPEWGGWRLRPRGAVPAAQGWLHTRCSLRDTFTESHEWVTAIGWVG